MTHVGSVSLYASGLGLMLYSPAATTELKHGESYMPDGMLEEPLRSLVAGQPRPGESW